MHFYENISNFQFVYFCKLHKSLVQLHLYRQCRNICKLILFVYFIAINFIGLLIVNYTPLFDFVSYIFLPFTKLLGLGDEAYTVAKACSITIVEMFSSSSIIMDSSQLAKSVIAIVCVSEILYCAAPIPCMLATDIPIRIRDIIVIWIERIIFSLILAVPFAYLFLI